jgi:hypothetical protein
MSINNAFLSLFRLYEEPDGRLRNLADQTGGIAQMVKLLAEKLHDTKGSPWEIVARMTEETAQGTE